MEPKTLLIILVNLAIIYFYIGPGSRFLKKKSHHYIDQPASKSDLNWIPINMGEYLQFIILRKKTQTKLDSILKFLNGKSHQNIKFSETSDWIIINTNRLSFEEFHELILFYDTTSKENAFGFCRNLKDNAKDYIAKFDIKSEEAHLYGVFRDNTNFGIFLPKADSNELGNMSKSDVKELDFNSEIQKIPYRELMLMEE